MHCVCFSENNKTNLRANVRAWLNPAAQQRTQKGTKNKGLGGVREIGNLSHRAREKHCQRTANHHEGSNSKHRAREEFGGGLEQRTKRNRACSKTSTPIQNELQVAPQAAAGE